MQQVHIPLASLIMSPARNKVLESWGLLCVICSAGCPLHIAKLALEGPRLHKLLDMSSQHLHQSMQSVMPLRKFKACKAWRHVECEGVQRLQLLGQQLLKIMQYGTWPTSCAQPVEAT